MKLSKSQVLSIQVSEIQSHFRKEIALKVKANVVPLIVERIEFWVGNQCELTSILCDCIVQYAAPITEDKAAAIVDFIVEKKIINGWGNAPAAPHFSEIEQIIVQDEIRDIALILYLQILQRGKVPASNGPGQALLLRSGLVISDGSYLRVANPMYEKVFSLVKVEQMLPGITKPVKVISSVAKRKGIAFSKQARHRSQSSNLHSKFAVVACSVAVLGALISSYIRESGGRALATSSEASNGQPALSAGAISSTSGEPSLDTISNSTARAAAAVERDLFDRGEAHATSSRWVLMMRQFCDIPETSIYFSSAKKQIEQLSKLSSEDIKLARDVVEIEKGTACSL